MIILSLKHCSAPRSIGRSSPSRDSPIWMPPGNGQRASCIGTIEEHRHSGIRYVTPAQRHAGQDGPVLIARHAVYQDARQRNPQRWSGSTRNWTPAGAVTLNPERDIVVRAATSQIQLSGSIGEPAFPPRPGSAQAATRNAGDGRSGATRNHAQSALAHEHGETPDLLRSEHRGTLGTSRRFASPDTYPASTAASSIGEIITGFKRQLP